MVEDYEQQLHKVKLLLVEDPNNGELQEMAKQLSEAIALAKDVKFIEEEEDAAAAEEGEDEEAEAPLAPGTKVQAVWSEDGEWYNGTVRSVTPNGYVVVYDGWNNEEEVDAANIRVVDPEDGLVEAEREAEATKQAIKRKIALAADVGAVPRDLPLKLRIKPDDPEEIRQVKRKKIHAFKSKVRLEQMELAQNKRQNAWHQFQTSKGKSKKVGTAAVSAKQADSNGVMLQVGFFTGRKKESIFKSPDDPRGKVGVTGSGKGITEFQKREKHLHPKSGGTEVEE